MTEKERLDANHEAGERTDTVAATAEQSVSGNTQQVAGATSESAVAWAKGHFPQQWKLLEEAARKVGAVSAQLEMNHRTHESRGMVDTLLTWFSRDPDRQLKQQYGQATDRFAKLFTQITLPLVEEMMDRDPGADIARSFQMVADIEKHFNGIADGAAQRMRLEAKDGGRSAG